MSRPAPTQTAVEDPLKLGIWGPNASRVQEALEAVPDVRPRCIPTLLHRPGVNEVDCLIVTIDDFDARFGQQYEWLRAKFPSVPLVFLVPNEVNDEVDSVLGHDPRSGYVHGDGTDIPGGKLVIASKRLSDAWTDPRRQWTHRLPAPFDRFNRAEFYTLWAVALLTYGVGDLVSTIVAVSGAREASELNPFVASSLDLFGPTGFIILKGGVFAILLGISLHGAKRDDHMSYYAPPVLAIAVGVFLTVWNVRVILVG